MIYKKIMSCHFDQREKSKKDFSVILFLRNDIKILTILFLIIFSFCFQSTLAKDYVFNVTDYGANGDGITLDTKAIQRAVNDAGSKGGKVVFPAGRYLSGTIFLKNNVTLEITEGAVLLGSKNPKDYPDTVPTYRSYNDLFLTQSLIYAEGLKNISIIGRGTIDGQGSAFKVTTRVKPDRYKNRPFIIRFIKCSNILVENVMLTNSAMWMQQYLACDYLTIRGIKVYNHANQNNDMIDIDGCHNVIVSDCFGDTDDDGITLKSTSSRLNENVTITNCVVSSHCNAIKMGTETSGGFKNISISNIVVKPSSSKTLIYGKPGGLAGIALEIVDGGIMEGVTISNINVNGVETPLFMRLGNRARKYKPEIDTPKIGIIKNVSISNIIATDVDTIASSFSGLKEHPIENISLSNISIYTKGGSKKVDLSSVPEREREYPENSMFGKLPAYGIFIRHAKNISLNNIELNYSKDDLRSAIVIDDAEQININGLRAKNFIDSDAMLHFNNVDNVSVLFSKSKTETKQFLKITGEKNKNIKLIGNDFSNIKKNNVTENGIIFLNDNIK